MSDLLCNRKRRFTFLKYAVHVVGVKDAFVVMHFMLFVMWAEVPDGGEIGLVSRYLWTCRGKWYRKGNKYFCKVAS